MTRKLATIRTIEEIKPIEGADAIEAARVDGWWVVIKKGEYAVGATVIYLEIDSWVPQELAPFLVKGAIPREYNGVKGERLRTIRLRGTLSQGLLLKIEDCFKIIEIEGKKYINMSENNKVARTQNVYIQDNKQN